MPKLIFPNFSLGACYYEYVPGSYALCRNAHGAFGYLCPGPREVADIPGITAGFRTIAHFDQSTANNQLRVTASGGETRIYEKGAGTWTLKDTRTGRAATDAVIFNGYLHIGYGSSGKRTWHNLAGVFVDESTAVDGSQYAKYFVVRDSGLTTPQLAWVHDPDELWVANNPVGGAVVGFDIGPSTSNQDYFTSITKDDSGVLVIGKSSGLYTFADGVAVRIHEAHPRPNNVSTSARDNYEKPVELDGRLYFPIQGWDILEYYHGHVNEYIAPRFRGGQLSVISPIPRASLPINAMTKAHGWLLLAMGASNSATLKNASNAYGGSALYQNTFSTTSDLWMGRYFGDVFVWHGVILESSLLLRHMHFDQSDNYLYMFSGTDAARRCYFPAQPLHDQPDSSNVILATGNVYAETGIVDFGAPDRVKQLSYYRAQTGGLAGTSTPSHDLNYRFLPYEDTSAFTVLDTFTRNERARFGLGFPRRAVGKRFHFRFGLTGDATTNSYAILHRAEVEAEEWLSRNQ